MPTTRLFTYLPPGGLVPFGVSQYDNIMVQDFSDPGSPYVGYGGYEWFYGPDEDLAYIISHESGPKTRGSGTGLITGTCVGWWKSKTKTEASFVSLTKMIAAKYGKVITLDDGTGNYYPYNPVVGLSGYGAKTWLESSETVPAHTPFWTSYPSRVAYTYYKWEIIKTKGDPPNANCTQASEFVFMIDGVTQSMDGVIVTNPNGNNPVGEEPPKLIDGSLNFKALDLNFVTNNKTEFIFQLPAPRAFTGYTWATANDEPSRDPSQWNLWGSDDGLDWMQLHTIQVPVSVTGARQTWVGIYSY